MFYLLIVLLQMKLIRRINDLNKAIKSKNELGFVPTMGGLHKGHESLIKISKKKCKFTIVSIFINPKQFNNKNDFRKYPRDLNKDIIILKKLKVDFVYLPSVNEIYKDHTFSKFKLRKSQQILCAKHRKGHFEGVLDIMNRLTKTILPKYIFMGEKDFQQLFLVKKILEKNYKVKIISCKTIRNVNKVALSTRNFLLKNSSIIKAGFIAKKLINLKSRIIKDKKNSQQLLNNTKIDLVKNFDIKIEYLETRNTTNLSLNIINKNFKIFIAYYIDNVRLIDNF
ncbi:MAG: pantoate--beta-alanine ligase [Candidatus Pelagibacter sp.]|jgi:pantoate--beta-alanine ligase|nr:pantoate--beta-alanine ligase [Candidatus Pelagibacter sp.]MBT3693441.1 pantoate--beta-alanine ligase [Candidatus Pelagibacter sp.]